MTFRAEAKNYDELHAAFRARAEQLRVTRLELDDLCNTTAFYMSKFMSLAQTRKAYLGTLGKVLAGLGLKLIVVEDEQATKEILPRITPRVESRVRHRDINQMPAA